MKINHKSWHYKLIKNNTHHYYPEYSLHTNCAYIEALILACLNQIFILVGIGFIFHFMVTEFILWGYFTRFDTSLLSMSIHDGYPTVWVGVGLWLGIIFIVAICLIVDSPILSNIYKFCTRRVCSKIEYVDDNK